MTHAPVSLLRLLLVVLFVFMLTILPLPHNLTGFRPPCVLMLVLYVQLVMPGYFNVTLLLFLGLCLDVLLATVIGEHALALIITTWFATGQTRSFGLMTMLQQMLVIAGLCMVYQLIIFLIDVLLGYHSQLWMVPSMALCSFLVWPWFRWTIEHWAYVEIKPRNPIQ